MHFEMLLGRVLQATGARLQRSFRRRPALSGLRAGEL